MTNGTPSAETDTARLERAFAAAPREAFLPEEMKQLADEDRPLSIGFDQTNSQPSTVRRMLEWLNASPGAHVLDVGSGSGWTTALLAHLVGPSGTIDAVERIPQLVAFGRQNCDALGMTNVKFHQADGGFGWPDEAPYDNILVSAGADELPHELVDQLKDGGTLVIPIRDEIEVITKAEDGAVGMTRYPGFLFVPLVEE